MITTFPACDEPHPSLVDGDWEQDQDAVINQPENPSQEEDDEEKELTKALNNLNLCQNLSFFSFEYEMFPRLSR